MNVMELKPIKHTCASYACNEERSKNKVSVMVSRR